ncbi:receptor-like protein kinase [Populus alba x Populus x berolinensis]|nr:receptor-like protein kinase [Populus alba x Populus x berolinensis]
MGGSPDLDLLRFLVLILLSRAHTYAVAETTTGTAAACPMDFSYVFRIPWNRSLCQNFRPPDENDNTNTSKPQCCQSLLSLFGIAVAQHLKETSLFHLPNLATSISCLRDYQSKLNSFSLANNLVSYCLDPLQFVTKPNICARIESLQDWVARLGKSTSLDTACKSDLTDNTACDGCVRAGYKVQALLLSIDGNQTHATDCFYFAILYAAGIVNEFGPESDGAASCIFGLELNSRVGSASKAHSALVFGLTGAGVALLVMFSLLGLYFWYDKKWRRKRNSGFGFDLDEQQGSRPRLRPNTGSIWFKIQDLEKATDNFSQKNFIGRGGCGFVYRGTLSDGTVVAIKRVIESDFQAGKVEEALDASLLRCGDSSNSNPKGIMERFVLVGILCAHVMVALRPTILVALKMLEGDIEVPPIPDRPMPLGHPSFHGDGNNFSISPALSGDQNYLLETCLGLFQELTSISRNEW